MSRSRRPGWTLFAGAITPAALSVWLAVTITSAAANTNPSDVHATRAYLQAEIRVYHALVVDAHRDVTAGEALAVRLAGECPRVAVGAPRGAQAAKLELEAFYAASLAFFSPDLRTIRHAVETLSHLRWSNQKVTKLVDLVAREDALTLIPSPDVCGDWKSWVASGYKILPPGTARFIAQLGPGLGGGETAAERVGRLLNPYEGTRERSLHHRLDHLRRVLVQRSSGGLLAVLRKVETALGLPLPAPILAEPGAEAIQIQPPPAVVQSDGKRLSEFYLGRRVTAESGCLACHRIGEDGNTGPGPDLTRVGSRLTGTQIARALKYARAPMPSFSRLPTAKFNAVVEFLSLLR